MNTKMWNVGVFFSFDFLVRGYVIKERNVLKDVLSLLYIVYNMPLYTTHHKQNKLLDPYELDPV